MTSSNAPRTNAVRILIGNREEFRVVTKLWEKVVALGEDETEIGMGGFGKIGDRGEEVCPLLLVLTIIATRSKGE